MAHVLSPLLWPSPPYLVSFLLGLLSKCHTTTLSAYVCVPGQDLNIRGGHAVWLCFFLNWGDLAFYLLIYRNIIYLLIPSDTASISLMNFLKTSYHHFYSWVIFHFIFIIHLPWCTSRSVLFPCYRKWSNNKYGRVNICAVRHGLLHRDIRNETADSCSPIFNLLRNL